MYRSRVFGLRVGSDYFLWVNDQMETAGSWYGRPSYVLPAFSAAASKRETVYDFGSAFLSLTVTTGSPTCQPLTKTVWPFSK